MDLAARGPSAVVRAALLVASACLVTGASSCSRSSDSTSEPTATLTSDPPATTSTTTIEDVEADVEAAVVAASRAYYQALEDPDPDDDRLQEHRTDESLVAVRRFVDRLRAEGQAASYQRGGVPRTVVQSVQVAPDSRTAEVVTCTVDRSELVDTTTNEVLDGTVRSIEQRHFVERSDSEWQVAEVVVLSREAGGSGCE